MENEDSAITFGLLFCLAVAIIGLYLGSGAASDQASAPRVTEAGQVLGFD